MNIFKAMYAFYQSLFSKECEHGNIMPGKKHAPYCPDCGYKVKCAWMQVRCRECDSRMIPRKMPDGKVQPLLKHCKHCGATDYRLSQVDSITAHELYLSVALKEIDYTEERKHFVSGEHVKGRKKKHASVPPIPPANGHYYADAAPFDIVDGQVLRARYFSQTTRSAWEEAPMNWGSPSGASPSATGAATSAAKSSNPFALPHTSSYQANGAKKNILK